MPCLRGSQSEASNAGQDVVSRLDPHEGFGIGVVGGQVDPNGILQRAGAAVAATTELLVGQFLIDRGGIVRWSFTEGLEDGLNTTFRTPNPEELMSAASQVAHQ